MAAVCGMLNLSIFLMMKEGIKLCGFLQLKTIRHSCRL